jgi:PIN domain nuclease of toxin-antitoxin system
VDLGLDDDRAQVPLSAGEMILLDTNALIWVERGHARARQLLRRLPRPYISPASLLELQFLQETGQIKLSGGTIESLGQDDRWMLDDPPAVAWFLKAAELNWTRDPFDRLLAAHATLRGWRLATSDEVLLEHLGSGSGFEL